jgi:DNA-directed RNA polymerase alpha subunit
MTIQQRDQPDSDFPAGLSNPARRTLTQAGYSRLEQLTDLSEDQLKQLHGVGQKVIDLLRRALAANGLSFADGKQR